MHPGSEVEVHTTFNDSWSPGFVVAEVVAGRYRLRRASDGAVLPNLTSEDDLRPKQPASPFGAGSGPAGR